MSDPPAHRIDLHGTTVEYTVRRSEDATKARIDVDVHGVTVTLPAGVAIEARRVLEENAAWVVERVRDVDAYLEAIPDRSFEPGAEFPYLNDPHEVVVETRSYSDVVDGEFRLAAHHVEQTSIRRALETFYRRKARARFEARAEHFAEEIGVEYDKIEVRNQRTKWGSCSSTGTLSLNWRLLMGPPAVLDYVVVHELCHRREPNHSEAFWALVAEYDPEYRAHSRWLDENGARLVFSDDDL